MQVQKPTKRPEIWKRKSHPFARQCRRFERMAPMNGYIKLWTMTKLSWTPHGNILLLSSRMPYSLPWRVLQHLPLTFSFNFRSQSKISKLKASTSLLHIHYPPNPSSLLSIHSVFYTNTRAGLRFPCTLSKLPYFSVLLSRPLSFASLPLILWYDSWIGNRKEKKKEANKWQRV